MNKQTEPQESSSPMTIEQALAVANTPAVDCSMAKMAEDVLLRQLWPDHKAVIGHTQTI